ncbi:MAG: hypothetical protein WDW38_010284 [Sanguina aurantia]
MCRSLELPAAAAAPAAAAGAAAGAAAAARALAPSMRICTLDLRYVDMATGLLPLGAHFPRLTKLRHLALKPSDFSRPWPDADAASGASARDACTPAPASAPRKRCRDGGHDGGSASGVGAAAAGADGGGSGSSGGGGGGPAVCCALPGSPWLSRFPALRELKVWLDPRDLPCVGGQHRLHIQAPFLRKINLRFKPRPYPIVFSGRTPWLVEFDFAVNGREPKSATPIMLGLGDLLASSSAPRVRLVANAFESRFSYIEAALLSRCAGRTESVLLPGLMARLEIVTEAASRYSSEEHIVREGMAYARMKSTGAVMEREGSLPWAPTLRVLKLHSMQQLTSARLQQAVGALPSLEVLTVSGGAEMLHCLRLHSASLLEVQLEGLNHLLTWDMNCPSLQKIDMARCTGRDIDRYQDHPVAGAEPDPAFRQATTVDVMNAWLVRGIFEERWLEALLDGHPSLQLPSLRSVTLGDTSGEALQHDHNDWVGEIPRLILACKAGHPTLGTLTVHNKLGIRQLVLQKLPALQRFEYTAKTGLPQLRFLVVDPALMAQIPTPELSLPDSAVMMQDTPLILAL